MSIMASHMIFPLVPIDSEDGMDIPEEPSELKKKYFITLEGKEHYLKSGFNLFLDRVLKRSSSYRRLRVQKAGSFDWCDKEYEIEDSKKRLDYACWNRRVSKVSRSSECLGDGFCGKKMVGMEKAYVKMIEGYKYILEDIRKKKFIMIEKGKSEIRHKSILKRTRSNTKHVKRLNNTSNVRKRISHSNNMSMNRTFTGTNNNPQENDNKMPTVNFTRGKDQINKSIIEKGPNTTSNMISPYTLRMLVKFRRIKRKIDSEQENESLEMRGNQPRGNAGDSSIKVKGKKGEGNRRFNAGNVSIPSVKNTPSIGKSKYSIYNISNNLNMTNEKNRVNFTSLAEGRRTSILDHQDMETDKILPTVHKHPEVSFNLPTINNNNSLIISKSIERNTYKAPFPKITIKNKKNYAVGPYLH